MSKLALTLALLALILVWSIDSGQAAPINLVSNPSFELGTYPGDHITVYPVQTTITDWTVTAGCVDYVGTGWQSADGDRSIDMAGWQADGTLQSKAIATIPGQTYTVIFAMAGNPDGGPTTKSLTVKVDGHSYPFTFDTTGKSKTNMGWEDKSFSFVASGYSVTLEFVSTSGWPYYHGAAIDNVRMFAPLPASVLLLGTGLAGLGLLGFRRRQS